MSKLHLRHKAFVANNKEIKLCNLGLVPEVQLNQSVVACIGHVVKIEHNKYLTKNIYKHLRLHFLCFQIQSDITKDLYNYLKG